MWKFLLSCLMPGVDEPEDVPEDEPEDVPEDEPEDVPEDEPEDVPEDEPAPKLSRGQRDIIAARSRAQDAEEKLRKAQAELEEARRTPARQPQATEEQRIYEQEEAVLKNPEASDWQKYAVQSNRAARDATRMSQNAMQQAADIRDQANFERFAVGKPKLYDAYKERVEERKKTLPDVPRTEILAYMMGCDMRDGKLKNDEKKPPKQGGVPRGSTPGARSDVTSNSGRMSESEKRTKRLENIRI